MSHKEVIIGTHHFKMHRMLCEEVLDQIKKHNKDDWDFKLLVSGDGMTRTGKSTIAVQIAFYLDHTFAANWKERMIFDGNKLIETANKLSPGQAIVYDEAKAGLDSKKQMEKYTKNLLDFFSQCGNLNLFVIIVLPEFFELPKGIALTQSRFLINCYSPNGYTRGYFEFYNRKDKRYLYIKGTKYLDYTQQKATFTGTFTKYLPFNRLRYERLKTDTLTKIRNRENISEVKKREELHRKRVTVLIKKLQELGIKIPRIADLLIVDRTTVYNYLKGK